MNWTTLQRSDNHFMIKSTALVWSGFWIKKEWIKVTVQVNFWILNERKKNNLHHQVSFMLLSIQLWSQLMQNWCIGKNTTFLNVPWRFELFKGKHFCHAAKKRCNHTLYFSKGGQFPFRDESIFNCNIFDILINHYRISSSCAKMHSRAHFNVCHKNFAYWLYSFKNFMN